MRTTRRRRPKARKRTRSSGNGADIDRCDSALDLRLWIGSPDDELGAVYNLVKLSYVKVMRFKMGYQHPHRRT